MSKLLDLKRLFQWVFSTRLEGEADCTSFCAHRIAVLRQRSRSVRLDQERGSCFYQSLIGRYRGVRTKVPPAGMEYSTVLFVSPSNFTANGRPSESKTSSRPVDSEAPVLTRAI